MEDGSSEASSGRQKNVPKRSINLKKPHLSVSNSRLTPNLNATELRRIGVA